MVKRILVVGAGLAGCEVAFSLASNGLEVVLCEAKRKNKNPAQKINDFAELVCTNSLKSKDPYSSHGLLKTEMMAMGSVILSSAKQTAVPAGDALAVDRELFSKAVTEALEGHEKIKIIDRQIDDPIIAMQEFDCQLCVISTGPLTSSGMENWIKKEISSDDYYFYDAIAPVVDADTLDYSKLYFKDRYKEANETADYLNAPMTKEQYENFIEQLISAKKTPVKEFESEVFFESCLPIDVMAERGRDTARFSCMKPVGLSLGGDRRDEPYAVVQLRKENLIGSAYNLVGFQTRLTYSEQVRVFRLIPGLEQASFLHLGSVHRNSFLNTKKLLNEDLSLKKDNRIYFAGQITGVEGYTESAACGLYVASQILRKIKGKQILLWPKETAIGALINYILTSEKPSPSNINFGLMPTIPLSKDQRKKGSPKMMRKKLVAQRAIEVFTEFLPELQS